MSSGRSSWTLTTFQTESGQDTGVKGWDHDQKRAVRLPPKLGCYPPVCKMPVQSEAEYTTSLQREPGSWTRGGGRKVRTPHRPHWSTGGLYAFCACSSRLCKVRGACPQGSAPLPGYKKESLKGACSQGSAPLPGYKKESLKATSAARARHTPCLHQARKGGVVILTFFIRRHRDAVSWPGQGGRGVSPKWFAFSKTGVQQLRVFRGAWCVASDPSGTRTPITASEKPRMWHWGLTFALLTLLHWIPPGGEAGSYKRESLNRDE